MMLLDSHDLTRLSRLLGDAMELPPAEAEGWFARLPNEDQPLVPRLREMLAMNHTLGLAGFLTRGPQADLDAIDGIALTGDRIGPYQLIRAIGSGGMGDVWLAERVDGSLKRQVALKLPRLAWGAGLAERMARERDIGARLEHPHIARLYDAGVDDQGRPYLAFAYIEGQAIDVWCDAGRLSVGARLRLFLQVLQAVAYAHGRLVVHRDLKPANVLVAADGQAHLLDFGIAKLLEETVATDDSQLTRRVGHMLTPAYASPEQIRDEPLTVASDIYSLGVMLHELLTGGLPFLPAGSSAARTLDGALHVEATRPSRLKLEPQAASLRGCDRPARLASELAGDLDTIVLKAIRKSPADRYSSVERFAGDVERYLNFQPITARPPSLTHRLRLFERRHRPAIAMAGVGTTCAIVLAVLLWQQHARTAAQSTRADAVRDFMLDMVEDVEPDQAHPGQEITGRQMLKRGLERAHDRFRTEPRMLGEVLSELYRMLDRIGDDEAKQKILDEAYALLTRSAPHDDAALNKVRVQLAEVALGNNRLDEAVAFARTALEACTVNDAECAKARSYANGVLGIVEGRRGNVAESLKYQRRVIAETERGFGADHAESAIAWYALAVAARNSGEYDEAEQAVVRAVAINERTTLPAREHADIARLHALVLQDQGRFANARDELVQLLKQDADGAERSRLLRLMAGVELALGHVQATLTAADQALALVDPNDHGIGQLFIHQSRAMASSLAGRSDDALAELGTVAGGLMAAGYGPSATESLRARRLHAEILARAGRYGEAATILDSLVADLTGMKNGGPGVELALALDLLGCVRRSEGRALEAIAFHEQARVGLLKKLKPEHPFAERNELYRLRARFSAESSDVALADFQSAANRYASRFDEASVWRRMVEPRKPGNSETPGDGVPMIL